MSKKTPQNTDPARNQKSRTVRERIDILRSRAGQLSGKDKLLMTMYLENANTFRQMARLAGVNEVTVSRRIHRITKRLLDGGYIIFLRKHRKLTKLERNIAHDYFIEGLAQMKISVKRKCSLYYVRKTLIKIQSLVGL